MQLSFADVSDEYQAFVDKFKPKKTTDDCYTPPEIYQVVLDYVVGRYGIDPSKVVRPFWPGGDYQREEYPEGCAVVDNPPFSLLSQIIDHYMVRGVPFFLFAPTLTAISHRRWLMDTNHIICHTAITYENGAQVNTSFITNMDGDGTVLECEPWLSDAINAKDKELQSKNKKKLPKYEYPDHVIHAARASYYSSHSTPFKVRRSECCPISTLDAMGGRGIFGGGLLLSDKAAAEKEAAEKAAAEKAAAEKWKLSERELKIVAMLNTQGGSNVN